MSELFIAWSGKYTLTFPMQAENRTETKEIVNMATTAAAGGDTLQNYQKVESLMISIRSNSLNVKVFRS